MSEPKPYKHTPDNKERTCLKCQEKFISSGKGNRICKECSTQNNRITSNEYTVTISHKKSVHE